MSRSVQQVPFLPGRTGRSSSNDGTMDGNKLLGDKDGMILRVVDGRLLGVTEGVLLVSKDGETLVAIDGGLLGTNDGIELGVMDGAGAISQSW